MAPPISDERRAAIEQDLRARWGEVGIAVIARAHGVAPSSVQGIARRAGIDKAPIPNVNPSARQSDPKNGQEDRRARLAAKRQALSEQLLQVMADTLAELNHGSVVTGISFGEVVSGTAGRLTARDRQALLTAYGIAADKHRMLENFDSSEGAGEIANFLRALAGGAP